MSENDWDSEAHQDFIGEPEWGLLIKDNMDMYLKLYLKGNDSFNVVI